MKKFITYISMQPENNLNKVKYEPVDDDNLHVEQPVCFPVSVLVDNYVDKGEKIEVLCLKEINNPNIERNYEILQNEIGEILKDRGVECVFRKLELSDEENIDSHLNTFAKIIDCIDEGDKVYACATYGTKPIPVVEMMALDYAYRVKKNVSVESVVYGKIDRRNKDKIIAKLYNITALFFMSQIVGHLADQKVADPEKMIRNLLGLGIGEV